MGAPRVRRRKEAPLAASILSSGRRWNPLDIADSGAVDKVGFGLMTVGYDDSDGGFLASARGLAR